MTEYDFNLKTVGRFACALLMVCALLTGAVAQSEAGSAAIEGTVVDPDNKLLAGVRVTVRSVGTGYKRIMTTDAEGQYVALVMPVGTYLVEAVANGFSASRFEAVELTGGVRKTLNFSLTAHAVTEGVVVSANPATIERQEMATSNSIGVRAIGDLPIRGRNFPEFAKLTPAIVQESDQAFFFVSAEQYYLRVPFFVEFEPQEGGVIVPAELRALEGQYNSTNDPTSVFARSDITLNNRDSLSVYYTYARQYGENFNPIQGRYDFKSLSDCTAGKIDRFRQTIYAVDAADLVFHGAQKELAFYAQDKISLHRDLALTAGLRWEGQWNPQPDNPNPAIPETGFIPNDLGQWQPRLGLA